MAFRFLLAIAAALLLSGAAFAVAPGHTARTVEVRLNDSMAASQLETQLPMTLQFDDHMGTAQVAQVADGLDIEGAHPASSYRAGDVAYWAPDQSLIVFLTDGSAVPTHGLVVVGRVTNDVGELGSCAHNCVVRLIAR
jgi:hypothetical protein